MAMSGIKGGAKTKKVGPIRTPYTKSIGGKR